MKNFAFKQNLLSRSGLLLTSASALLLSGCVDPKARLHDFENLVLDATVYDAQIDAAPRDVPDITGTFYVAFVTKGIDPDMDHLVNLIWTFEVTKGPNGQPVSLNMNTRSLNPQTRQPAMGDTLVALNNVPISPGGEFQLDFKDFILVADANFTMGDLLLNQKLNVTIQSANVICAVVIEGAVVTPIPLDLKGSSAVGVRVPPGTVGNQLPAAVIECPQVSTMPDGGLPDGGPVDASIDAHPDAT